MKLNGAYLATWLVIGSALPAQPQVQAGPEPLSGNSSGYAGQAPLFQIPNFIGDRRVDDLYYYLHPVEREQWDVYIRRLQAAAGRIVNMQPLRQSPTPDRPNNAAANLMTGLTAPGTFQGHIQDSQSMNGAGPQAQCAQQQASCSPVTAEVRGEMIPLTGVPGLIDP